MGIIGRIQRHMRRYYKELFLFWKYALRKKLHLLPYHSDEIILLRLDLLGDCVMFTSAAKAIRALYPDKKMTVVCLASSKPVFDRLAVFDKIISVDFKPQEIDCTKLRNLIKEIREDSYDILLQPQASKYPLADILAAATKCNKRISLSSVVGNSSAGWIKMTHFLYDTFIPLPAGDVSEFEYYGAFVRGIGNPNYKITRPCLPYQEQHLVEGHYYILYPGGSFSQKFWPSERFARIADYIFEKTGLPGVILGVSDEQWVSDRLKSNLNIRTRMAMVDLTGRTSVSDVIDLIGNAEFVISNDTSGVHIACATNTPSVVNVGGWHYGRFLPYKIEQIELEDRLPLVAHVEMPCYYCNLDWNIIFQRNRRCWEHLKCGEPFECIEKITYEEMRDLVNNVIDRKDYKYS